MFFKLIFFPCLLVLFINSGVFSQQVTVKSPLRFLALGDSYTIGQGVPLADRWPYQLAQDLYLRGIETEKLTIIAQTGWRTDNLIDAISQEEPESNYNLVSLLIGVNNQYQGRKIEVYPSEFRQLLETAVALCGGRKEGVFVLSIPDYGYTPFGFFNQTAISAEIDQYNQINRNIAMEMGIAYYDITPISREVISKPGYLASDNLHPSGEMYEKWVELIVNSANFEINTLSSLGYNRNKMAMVFPNPARNFLTIRTPQKSNMAVIYDGQGSIIWQSVISAEQEFNIDVSDWSNGIYYYRIKQINKADYSGKFLIEKY